MPTYIRDAGAWKEVSGLQGTQGPQGDQGDQGIRGNGTILHAANAGASSITLALGSGNYFVEFYYTTHLSDGINAIMVIDGTNVQTSSAYAYDGTYYLPMFGAKSDVSGSRTITCSITNGMGFPNATVQRCMVKATPTP